MEGVYDIFRGGEKIGRAEVKRQGLYYQFHCCCNLTGAVVYRLTVQCGDKTENLGIPIPDADSYRLKTRIPVSHFKEGEPAFRAVPRHPENLGKWIPLSPEEPFGYLTRLENAVLEQRGNQVGILLKDESPALQDNGLNP